MSNSSYHRRRGFTLVELIVVIVIMSILAGFSAMAYRGIAADLRMSSAINTVTAALDNARAMAIKNNRYVITVFRPRLDNDGTEQIIDIVVADWSRDSANLTVTSVPTVWTCDRFVPVNGLQVRSIAGGINVAGPGYGAGDDDIWWVTTYLPANAIIPDTEQHGSIIGVLYNPEGRVVVRNAESGGDRIWVDFDSNGNQILDDSDSLDWEFPPSEKPPEFTLTMENYWDNFDLKIPGGEPFISMTTILAVFDEKECRSAYDLTGWYPVDTTDPTPRDIAYTEFINKNSDRIQFNRYSGVPLR